MKDLPPFSGDESVCSKCSHAGAATKWMEAETLGPSYLKRERLRRECMRCGYQWDEALNPPPPAA